MQQAVGHIDPLSLHTDGISIRIALFPLRNARRMGNQEVQQSPREGALIIFNDLERGYEAQYESWYNREHLPDRVKLPGFRSGRRYARVLGSGGRSYLAWYTTEDVSALSSPDYIAALSAPTKATGEIAPRMFNAVRGAYVSHVIRGEGHGGALLAWLRPEPLQGLDDLVDRIVGDPTVIALRALVGDAEATRAKDTTSEGKLASTPAWPGAWILLVETTTPEAAEQVRRLIVTDRDGTSASNDSFAVYRLLHDLRHDEVKDAREG
jgi:hypothetical protein